MKEAKKKRALPNKKGGSENCESKEGMQFQAEGFARAIQKVVPLLKRLEGKLEDTRQKGKITHDIFTLLVFGVLIFVFRCGSLREANRTIGAVAFANLSASIPGLKTRPHADTLSRRLCDIDAERLQDEYLQFLKNQLNRKEFRRLKHEGKHIVAVDGTGKFSKKWGFSEKALHRCKNGNESHFVYVLESVLILDNGAVLPLITEFLENGDVRDGAEKQDCEMEAWKRFAPKLKKMLGNNVLLLMDGLYAAGPIVQTCRKNKWDYLIVLKKDSIKSVWEDAEGLVKAEPKNVVDATSWNGRSQLATWANDIEYVYGNNHKMLKLNVLFLYESWEELHERSGGKPETKRTQWAPLSSLALNAKTALKLCDLARERWNIENRFKDEKHSGYMFEHCYSLDWNAMKAFHYLMKIGHFVNLLIVYGETFLQDVLQLGINGLLKQLRLVMFGLALDHDRLRMAANSSSLWRLNEFDIAFVT